MTGRAAIVLGTLAIGLGLSQSAYADVCIAADNGVGYQLQIGTATPITGTPILLSGTRVVSTIRTPVVGSLIQTSTQAFIGLEEMFNFGSGLFTHPNGTTIMTFPTTGTGQPTYDTTFHGNGAPHNVMGFIQVVACPLAETAGSASDPNRKQ